MDPIRLSFAAPLTEAGLAVTRSAVPELEQYLSARLLAELDEKIQGSEYGAHEFKARRTDAAHLLWEVQSLKADHLELVAAPTARLAGAFEHSTDLCSIWLRAETEAWLREKLGPGFSPFQLKFPATAALENYSPSRRTRKTSGASGIWKSLAVAIALLIMVTLGFTLYKVYSLIDEVQQSYTEIESTVDRKTEEILNKIERGITTSDRVVNMMDKVKKLVVPEDSIGRGQ
jgi:hypothetical protein